MTEAELKEAIRSAMYRLCLSNARWFAARKDGYSITVGHKTFDYATGEMRQWANYWVSQSELYAPRSVPGAEEQCTGVTVGSVTSASGAVSPLAADQVLKELILKPRAAVAYTAKSGERRSGIVLHGVPGRPDEAVLPVGMAGVKVKNVNGELVEIK